MPDIDLDMMGPDDLPPVKPPEKQKPGRKGVQGSDALDPEGIAYIARRRTWYANDTVDELQKNLVSAAEIAVRANVTRDTVYSWFKRYGDFPTPFVRLACGPIWDWRFVARWVARHRDWERKAREVANFDDIGSGLGGFPKQRWREHEVPLPERQKERESRRAARERNRGRDAER